MDSTAISHITINYKTLEKVVVPIEEIFFINFYGITDEFREVGKLKEKIQRAEYVLLQIKEFENSISEELSELYDNKTPYEQLAESKTVDYVTVHYKQETEDEPEESNQSEQKSQVKQPYSEDIYVEYQTLEPTETGVLGDNLLCSINETLLEKPYYEPVKGVELEFNVSRKPF